jgi:hypothetical protein
MTMPMNVAQNIELALKYLVPMGDQPAVVRKVFESDSRLKTYDWLKLDDHFPSYDEVAPSFYFATKNFLLFPCTIPHLPHEVAHMVEMNNFNRLIKTDWGFKAFYNSNYSRNELVAATAREIRVRAIADRLYHNYNPTRIINHSFWVSSMKGKYPIGRFNSDNEIDDWAIDLYHRTYHRWSEDRFLVEWNERIEFIFNWMETNENN